MIINCFFFGFAESDYELDGVAFKQAGTIKNTSQLICALVYDTFQES